MDNDYDQDLGSLKIAFVIFLGCVVVNINQNFLGWIALPRNRFIFIAVGVLLIVGGIAFLVWKIQASQKLKVTENGILGKDIDSVFCGITNKQEEVWIKPKQRSMHTQVIGTTNAGKTESVIIPWAVQDIFSGKGILLIDGKADNSLIDKLWSYTVKAGREKDFKLFSLSRRDKSSQFNPLIGGTAEEITERVFNAFDFENPYYRSLQYEVMNQVMRVFQEKNEIVTFERLHQVISNPNILEAMAIGVQDPGLTQWVQWYGGLSASDRENRTSGLLTAIGHFAFGSNAALYNANEGTITIEKALAENQIVYFQLPVLLSPFLGKATGKLVLQSLQAAVANRHRLAQGKERKFFSVYLDDFSEYLNESFISVLNKSRSANLGIVFAHQALGDIKVLGDPVANTILTNANLKILMRGNDPDSAEYFSKVIGTKSTTKFTERQKKTRIGIDKSGDVSAREVEEFTVHPNTFKKDLGVGEAIMIIPHDKGSKTVRLKFNKIDDLKPVELPRIEKRVVGLIQQNLNNVRPAAIPFGREISKIGVINAI